MDELPDSNQLCRVCCKRLGKKVYAQFFCKKRCYDDHYYHLYIEAYLSGEESGGNGVRISRRVRRWIYEKRGRKCEKCGWSKKNPATKKVPIEINHIDGDPTNHRPENLELLCPNCHSLTPTYGALNYKKGRESRKKKLRSCEEE